MPLHHTLLLPSSDRNPLTFESPLEKFDNLSRNRTQRIEGRILDGMRPSIRFYSQPATFWRTRGASPQAPIGAGPTKCSVRV